MTLNEIKKEFYKTKVDATLIYIRKGEAVYQAPFLNGQTATFSVPVSDMGDADFTPTMKAQLLLRWLVQE